MGVRSGDKLRHSKLGISLHWVSFAYMQRRVGTECTWQHSNWHSSGRPPNASGTHSGEMSFRKENLGTLSWGTGQSGGGRRERSYSAREANHLCFWCEQHLRAEKATQWEDPRQLEEYRRTVWLSRNIPGYSEWTNSSHKGRLWVSETK